MYYYRHSFIAVREYLRHDRRRTVDTSVASSIYIDRATERSSPVSIVQAESEIEWHPVINMRLIFTAVIITSLERCISRFIDDIEHALRRRMSRKDSSYDRCINDRLAMPYDPACLLRYAYFDEVISYVVLPVLFRCFPGIVRLTLYILAVFQF